MRNVTRHAFVLAAALAAGFCSTHAVAAAPAKQAAAAPGTLRITGSSTMAPMLAEFAKRFKAFNPGAQIEVEAGGSGRGITDVMQGKADIGMVSRPLTGQESALYSFAIGRDGIGVVVHATNPVRSLTNRQVADLYAGKTANWKSVGGRDAPVAVISPPAGYASVELFSHFFNVRAEDIKAQIVAGDNSARIRAIIGNPDGVTYVSVGSAQRGVESSAPIKLLPVDGVAATQKNIRSGNFPISRPLLLVTKEVPQGLLKEFIRFSLSSQVTDIVTRHDFVPYLD